MYLSIVFVVFICTQAAIGKHTAFIFDKYALFSMHTVKFWLTLKRGVTFQNQINIWEICQSQ